MDGELSGVSPGVTVRIQSVSDETTRARLLRLGFLDGPVECRRQIRNGPIIIRRNGTDLAIGAAVADGIKIQDPER